ncbi:MAG: hypothetical protein HQL52_20095, partial [Magnetococcales bacterium]|nr:hypothetical protein [Magnetococcales bacterium]
MNGWPETMAKTSASIFRKELAQIAEELRRSIEADVSGFDADPQAIQQRVARSNGDFQFFAETYFPHYLTGPASVLHRYLFKILPQMVDEESGQRHAIAAPRGEAKSTIATRIFTLWCVLTGRKKYIPIIMDAMDQAVVMLDSIKAELEVNPRLKSDYPDQVGEGRVWKEGVVITKGDAKVQAFGSGKRKRGFPVLFP